MTRTAGKTTTKLKHALRPGNSPVSGLILAVQLLDVTWRVAVPIIVLSLVGASLDHHLHTKPTYILIGFGLALITSSLLVYKQIKLAFPGFTLKKGGQK